jgi:hypothetical protein
MTTQPTASMIYPRRKALARQVAVRRRSMQVRSDDSLLIAYPKSGSTWLRFILANLESEDFVDFDTIRSLIPPLDRLSDPSIARRRNRLIKVHEQPRRSLVSRAGPSVYLVRDPVHVFLSYRDHLRATRGDDLELDRLVDAFLHGRVDGYGRWDQHVLRAVRAHRSAPGQLRIVRFEDLRRDPAHTVLEICEALGRPTTPSAVEIALRRSSAERMRELEASSTWLAQNRVVGAKPFVAGAGVRSEKDLPGDLKDRILAICNPVIHALDSVT